MDFTQALTWRYATKQFDSTKKLSEEQLTALLTDMNLTATSFGLQPFEIIVVTDPVVREKLRAVSWNQSQVVDASHLILLAVRTDVDESFVDAYIAHLAEVRGISVDAVKGYADMMKGFLSQHSVESLTVWAQKQAYIALGTLLASAAVREIDACPMEGFDANAVDDILGLTRKHLKSTVMCPVGYRSAEDKTAAYAKVRRPLGDVVHRV